MTKEERTKTASSLLRLLNQIDAYEEALETIETKLAFVEGCPRIGTPLEKDLLRISITALNTFRNRK
jgi:hypothetical protein